MSPEMVLLCCWGCRDAEKIRYSFESVFICLQRALGVLCIWL